jgi:Protein of unknown function (DUF4231)
VVAPQACNINSLAFFLVRRALRMTTDATMERLENQIAWYSARSDRNQHLYKWLKITVIVLAALIPLLSGLDIPSIASMGVPKWFLGVLGALIAIVEGIQQVNQYHANWISYRSTAESLKHEKFLYLAKAGPYLAAPDARVLLAERVEGIVSQEHANWFSSQKVEEKNKVETRG